MSETIARAGEYIKNPLTQRQILVGGRTYIKLVKRGILDGVYEDDNEVYEIEDEDDEAISMKKIELDHTTKRNKHVVRGRGRHAGKLVTRRRQVRRKKLEKLVNRRAEALLATYKKKKKRKVVYESDDDMDIIDDIDISGMDSDEDIDMDDESTDESDEDIDTDESDDESTDDSDEDIDMDESDEDSSDFDF